MFANVNKRLIAIIVRRAAFRICSVVMNRTKKRYAIVGTGSRSYMYAKALAGTFTEHSELVALCDTNRTRMRTMNAYIAAEYDHPKVPEYTPDSLETMLADNSVDALIVTSIDRTHHDYIARAMYAGCDAITEKPMTIDAEKARSIHRAIRETGRNLTVTFNYRYAPRNSKVKELLLSGAIGTVKSVHFEWLLDTRHGADYFRRWHRDKRNSGGLMVHKATHHFDLVNWWLASSPKEVNAWGDLVYYGRANAEARGETRFYDRATGSDVAREDPFALDLTSSEALKHLYLDAEHEDGYRRDQSVFSDGISIEDDIGVMVRYDSGALMTYHLTAYSPWEGFRVMFNGSEGRLEYEVVEASYVSADRGDHNVGGGNGGSKMAPVEPVKISVQRHWSETEAVEIDEGQGEGGHGGGDRRMLHDVFVGSGDDPLGRAADHIAGTDSILTGISANLSIARNRPIDVDALRKRIIDD